MASAKTKTEVLMKVSHHLDSGGKISMEYVKVTTDDGWGKKTCVKRYRFVQYLANFNKSPTQMLFPDLEIVKELLSKAKDAGWESLQERGHTK